MTTTQITNVALGLLGIQDTVADYDTELSMPAQAARLNFDLVRDELLRAKDWNFATKRAVLTLPWVTPSAIGDNGVFRITKATHGLATNDRVMFEASDNYEGLEGMHRITVINANTFDLNDSTFAGSGAVDTRYVKAPSFDFSYAYTIPSDYLKALEFNEKKAGTSQCDWEIVAGFLLSNDDPDTVGSYLRYTAQITDATTWPGHFVQIFAPALAAAMATPLSTDPQLGERMRLRAENIALQAAGPNNTETRPRAVLAQVSSHYLAARTGSVIP